MKSIKFVNHYTKPEAIVVSFEDDALMLFWSGDHKEEETSEPIDEPQFDPANKEPEV